MNTPKIDSNVNAFWSVRMSICCSLLNTLKSALKLLLFIQSSFIYKRFVIKLHKQKI